jgi:flagellar motility protein MotE (MotC chaperone)
MPIVLFALASLLVLKAVDLLGRGGVEITGPAPAFAGSGAEGLAPPIATLGERPADLTGSVTKAEEAPQSDGGHPAQGSEQTVKPSAGVMPPESQPAAGGAAKVIETADPLMPLGSGSASERAILERLHDRREALEQQSRELDLRENLLKAAEKRIEDRIAELKQLEARVGAAEQRQDDADASRMKSLVLMYETMKPKDAARIFDRLDITILVDVVTAMKPAKVADVMAAMDADAAKRLTVALAQLAKPKAPMPADGPVELPKIEGRPM